MGFSEAGALICHDQRRRSECKLARAPSCISHVVLHTIASLPQSRSMHLPQGERLARNPVPPSTNGRVFVAHKLLYSPSTRIELQHVARSPPWVEIRWLSHLRAVTLKEVTGAECGCVQPACRKYWHLCGQ